MPLSDAWDTDSGLLSHFVLLNIDFHFGPDERAEDQSRIYGFFTGAAYDVETGELLAESHTERFSTGNNWEPVSGGEAVENVAGGRLFNNNTGMGLLIRGIKDLAKEDPALDAAIDGLPTEAKTWAALNGLAFERRNFPWTPRTGPDAGKAQDRWVPIPYKYLPDFAPAGDEKPKAAPKKAAGGRRRKTDNSDVDVAALRAEVIAFANEFEEDEHDEFVAQVLDPDIFGQANDIPESLKAEILDPESEIWNG